MSTPVEAISAKLNGKTRQSQVGSTGFSYAPTVLSSSNSPGQQVLNRLGQRKDGGNNIYGAMRQQQADRVTNDLSQKSAGLKFDEYGKPQINLADFGQVGQGILKGIGNRGDIATQTAEAKQAYRSAVSMQNIGSYGLSGNFSVSGTAIPGASSNNVGAKAAAAAMQVAKNHVAYVWGGNSLSQGVDCSGLVQQIYKNLGISVPRVTYDQAKSGHTVPVSQIRPGDLVFYRPGSRGPEHVGIYVGNGKVVHAANPSLGVITSNLTNSNGAPLLVVRPY